MKSIEEIENKINELKQELEELKNKPTIEEIRASNNKNGFYYPDNSGYIHRITFDEDLSRSMNSVLTDKIILKQQAELDLYHVSIYLNGGKFLEFDAYGDNYGIYFNYVFENLQISFTNKDEYGCVYFNYVDDCKKAIEILGEKRIKEALGVFED